MVPLERAQKTVQHSVIAKISRYSLLSNEGAKFTVGLLCLSIGEKYFHIISSSSIFSGSGVVPLERAQKTVQHSVIAKISRYSLLSNEGAKFTVGLLCLSIGEKYFHNISSSSIFSGSGVVPLERARKAVQHCVIAKM